MTETIGGAMALLQGAPPRSDAVNQAIAESIRRGPPGGGWSILVPILICLGAFAFAGFVVWLRARQRRTEVEAMTELHKQLMGRFSSGTELASFLSSAGGQQLLDSMISDSGGTKQRIIRNVRSGIIISVLGAGFLGLSAQKHNFFVAAVLLLALGAGFLISAAISYRLSKTMGLLRNTQGGPTDSFPAPM